MRPVNQLPLSLTAMKRSPLVSRRMPDSPPKLGKVEVSTSPLRYCSEPNRRRAWSRRSKEGMGIAFTWMATGAVTERSSVAASGDGRIAYRRRAIAGAAAVENPAADIVRNPRRERFRCITLRMQAAAMAVRRRWRRVGLAEELGE